MWLWSGTTATHRYMQHGSCFLLNVLNYSTGKIGLPRIFRGQFFLETSSNSEFVSCWADQNCINHSSFTDKLYSTSSIVKTIHWKYFFRMTPTRGFKPKPAFWNMRSQRGRLSLPIITEWGKELPFRWVIRSVLKQQHIHIHLLHIIEQWCEE